MFFKHVIISGINNKMKNFLRVSGLIVLLANIAFSSYMSVNFPELNKNFRVRIAKYDTISYVSLNDFTKKIGARTYYRPENGKLLIFIDKKIIKFTINSSFLVIGTDVVNIKYPVLLVGNDIYAPASRFLNALKISGFPNLSFRINKDNIEVSIYRKSRLFKPSTLVLGNISKIKATDKVNGLVVIIDADKPFSDKDFSYYFRNNNQQFYLTIYGARVDSNNIPFINESVYIEGIKVLQLGESVQIIFNFNKNFISSDVHYDYTTGKILASLFFPDSNVIKEKIERAKSSWYIDTVVLDPGHGGKDVGTPRRRYRLNEKDIVLDIALRLGRLLEKKGIRVVYTRKKDVFLPLWKRTQIANNENGKLFISLHVNASRKSSRVSGIEFYLLRPGKSEDAIAVAEKENSVIRLESKEDQEKYKGYDDITNILANMVLSAYMKDSERLAEIVSENFEEKVPFKNRGVKQAGFYVLIGASMPSLLCEIGYMTNPADEKKLNSSKYRQMIAETLCESIIEFKKVCEEEIVGGR